MDFSAMREFVFNSLVFIICFKWNACCVSECGKIQVELGEPLRRGCRFINLIV